MISVLQLRAWKMHPLVGVKEFFEDEGYILKNRPAQNKRTILVLREHASHDFSAPTPQPENTSSRRSHRIFRRLKIPFKKLPGACTQGSYNVVLREYASHNFRASTQWPENTSSRRRKSIFWRWTINLNKSLLPCTEKSYYFILPRYVSYNFSAPTPWSRNSPSR